MHFVQLVIMWYVVVPPCGGPAVVAGGHGLDWFLQRNSTWLGLSQYRALLGEKGLKLLGKGRDPWEEERGVAGCWRALEQT